MITIANRYQVRPHPFIDGAHHITDTQPRRAYSTRTDWTAAPLSIIRAALTHAETLGDGIAVCHERERRLSFAKRRREIQRRKRLAREIAERIQDAHERTEEERQWAAKRAARAAA